MKISVSFTFLLEWNHLERVYCSWNLKQVTRGLVLFKMDIFRIYLIMHEKTPIDTCNNVVIVA